jgi:succinoglycan biosynthesis transport protein ExoP
MADTRLLIDAEPASGLGQYLAVLWRRKWIVVGTVVLAVAAAALFTARQSPAYKAKTTLVVGQSGGLVQPQNAGAIQPFSATMQELIKSSVVAQEVIRALGLKQSPESLLGEISIAFNPESAALNVSVVDTSPERAKAIAAEVGVAFSALVKERFGQPAAGAGSSATPPLTATVWDPAYVVPGKISPRPKLNLTVAAILGLVLGVLAAFVVDFFDRRLRTVDEIERALGVPVIGQIPSWKKGSLDRPRMLWDENEDFAESFRALRANLQYLAVNRSLRTMLVTSPAPGQGKTTVCANIAIALAQSGVSVAVLDADLRRPRLGEMFGIPPTRAGLTNALVGTKEISDVVSRVELPKVGLALREQNGNPVAVVTSGGLPPNPSELVGSPRMQQVIGELSGAFDQVIVDSPPMLLVADSLELAQHVDGVIVVVRLKEVTTDDVKELRALTDRLGITVVGAVVTDVPARSAYGYSHDSSERAGEPTQASPPAPATAPRRLATGRSAAQGRTQTRAPNG